MRTYILRRVVAIPVIIFVVSLIVFIFLRALPGDAADVKCGASGQADQTCVEGLRIRLGLTKCDGANSIGDWVVCRGDQYVSWLGNILIRGNFSYSAKNEMPVTDQLWGRIGVTLQVGLLAMLFSLTVGIPIGILSAVRAGRISDYIARFFSILAISVPNFWIGTLVVALPAYFWQYRTSPDWVGWDDPIQHLRIIVVPAAILALAAAGYIARIARSSMLEVLGSDYVRTARAKGLAELVVIGRHVLRPSMITIFTVIGLQFGLILGGSAIMEQIFTIPGLGQWIISSIFERDFQVVQAIALIFSTWFVIVVLLVDVGYRWIDPRIRN